MEKLQSTAANRLESLASRTLKVKRNASAKRTEVLVKISLEAEARQAKVGSCVDETLAGVGFRIDVVCRSVREQGFGTHSPS
jgi:hypothetical protein